MRKSWSRTAKITLMIVVLGVSADMHAVPKPKLKQDKPKDALSDYIARVKGTSVAAPTPGSLWSEDSTFADLASDYRAKKVNDIVIINIVEQTSSTNNGGIQSARAFSASSGITGLFGTVGPSNALQNLFSPNSARSLTGQAQASSSSTLQTTLGGTIVAVLPNGYLVIEAQRKEAIDNQTQTLTVRGVVRPGDLASNGSVNSTSISNLEILLNGHGVISDGVQPPNALIRTILKILNF
ncbi:MAG: flagellar basal body L-ring protein FlgH [Terriglobia bacterium]